MAILDTDKIKPNHFSKNFTDKKFCLKCGKEILIKNPKDLCLICYRETIEYKNSQKPIRNYIKPIISDYYKGKVTIELNCFNYFYNFLKKLGNYRENSDNVYFKGKRYRIVFPYKYTQCYSQYNESLRRLEYFTCIKLYFNGITLREAISRIFDDFYKESDNIRETIRICQDAIKYLKKFYTIPSAQLGYSLKKSKSSKTVFTSSKNQNKSYQNQLVDLIFNEVDIDFLTLRAEQNLENYKFEVYGLLDCIGHGFHKIEKNYYFEEGFLELLEYHLRNKDDFNRECIWKYINLRFEGNRLVVKFKRSINREIRIYGFVEKVLDNFIAIGITELFEVLDYYGINREVFENNTTTENYTVFHLAKEIRCNVETEQPELLNRLIDKAGKEKESLAKIGLDDYKHCIDYSHGIEYEIFYNKREGKSLDELKRDLMVLEQDIRPKQQTLDKYLDKNSKDYCPKFFMLLKGYLPITEFSIEPNKEVKNDFPLEYESYNELQDFNNLELLEHKTHYYLNFG